VCKRRLRVIIKGVGVKKKLLVFKTYIIVEYRLAGFRVIFSPVGHQYIILVHHAPTFKKVANAIKTVIVKTVRIQLCTAVSQHDIVPCLSHLVVAVIKGIVTEERQRVSLQHPYMPESLERVRLLIKIRTVTRQPCPLVTERHVAV